MKPQTHKHRKKAFGKVSRKTTEGWVGDGLKQVLLAQNINLDSNAALNNKYMFDPLPYLWNITVKRI